MNLQSAATSCAAVCLIVASVLGLCHCSRSSKPGAGDSKGAARPGPSGTIKVSEVRVADPLYKDRLTGIYDGTEGWRWGARSFSVVLDVSPPLEAQTDFEIDFAVPEELVKAVGEVTLSCKVNGQAVWKKRYEMEGRHTERFRRLLYKPTRRGSNWL